MALYFFKNPNFSLCWRAALDPLASRMRPADRMFETPALEKEMLLSFYFLTLNFRRILSFSL